MIIVSDKLKGNLPQNHDWFYIPTSPYLPREVAFHTDLRIFSFKDELICAPSIYDMIKEAVNLPVMCGEKEPTGKYPDDVPYNAVAVGKFLICNKKTTDKKILTEAEKHGLTVINVRQGYARCSVAVVSDKEGHEAIITADKGIAQSSEKNGIDVLEISSCGVSLTGFENGFIGGATVTTSDALLFFGNPENHPDGKEIELFCGKYNIKAVALTDNILNDYGSGIYVKIE